MIRTEQRNVNTMNLDKMSALEIAKTMNQENAASVAALEPVLPQVAQAIDIIADAFGKGGRMFYIGAGTSGRLAVQDAAECPPTFGVSQEQVMGIHCSIYKKTAAIDSCCFFIHYSILIEYPSLTVITLFAERPKSSSLEFPNMSERP